MSEPLVVKTVVEVDENDIKKAIVEYVERRGAKVTGNFNLREQGTRWTVATVPVQVTLAP